MGQVIEADEQGLLLVPTEMLGTAQPHGRYLVEVIGKKLSIEPEEAAEQRKQEYEEWKRGWDALTEEISKVWPEGVSAVDVVSEMRR